MSMSSDFKENARLDFSVPTKPCLDDCGIINFAGTTFFRQSMADRLSDVERWSTFFVLARLAIGESDVDHFSYFLPQGGLPKGQ